jgi:hypothetical protein
LNSQIFNSKSISNLKKFLWRKLFPSSNPSKPYFISKFLSPKSPFWIGQNLKKFEYICTVQILNRIQTRLTTRHYCAVGPIGQPPSSPASRSVRIGTGFGAMPSLASAVTPSDPPPPPPDARRVGPLPLHPAPSQPLKRGWSSPLAPFPSCPLFSSQGARSTCLHPPSRPPVCAGDRTATAPHRFSSHHCH